MLAKILVGVLAAIAVTGVGVYFALPDHCQSGCSSKQNAQDTLPVSEGSSCCAAHVETCPGETTEVSACIAPSNSDGLAACVGGMALSSAPAKTCVKCCDE